jgi:histidinol-phosphate/aromatic aminotransferase/cobyric acid decarboxylase-like protein
LKNLKKFKYKCFSNGSSQAFDYFHSKHNKKRLRFFKNDYIYHYLSSRNNQTKWDYLENQKIKKNDAVVISMPFSDSGSKHPEMENIVKECDKKNVPVLIDCCYYSMCKGINFDFNHKSIEAVVFSLSKAFPVSRLRIGMRLTKDDDDDQLFYYKKIQFVNKLSVFVGLKIIKKFKFDFLYKKYAKLQKYYCKKMNLSPSNVVAIAVGGKEWKMYNRGGMYNRLCLSSLFEKK